VIHWCGPKPTLSSGKVYSEPMNFCRRKCQEDVWNRTGLAADMSLQVEDLQRSIYVYKNKFKKKFRQLAGNYVEFFNRRCQRMNGDARGFRLTLRGVKLARLGVKLGGERLFCGFPAEFAFLRRSPQIRLPCSRRESLTRHLLARFPTR
jgi:hypothetical protein